MRTIHLRFRTDISKRYGRKLGYLRHHVFLLVQLLGGYREFMRVDWMGVTRLVFVCQGNICRSAYGEARARGLGLAASSFGLNSDNKSSANLTAVRVGLRRGVDLSAHFSTSADRLTLSSRDLLIGMEPWQGKQLKHFSQRTNAQVTLLGLWHSQPRPHVEDPYGLEEEYFDACFSIIDDAIIHIAKRMKVSYVT